MGSSQRSNFVARGHWAYSATAGGVSSFGPLLDSHGMPYYELAADGAAGRLELKVGHAYMFDVKGILHCQSWKSSVSADQQAIMFGAKGVFLARLDPTTAPGGAGVEVAHYTFFYYPTASGAFATTMGGTNPDAIGISHDFSFIIAQGATDPLSSTGPGPNPWHVGTASSAATVKFIIRENYNDAAYGGTSPNPAMPNFSSAVINVELIENGLYWDGGF